MSLGFDLWEIGSSDVSIVLPGAYIEDVRPLRKGVGVGVTTGISASAGGLGMVGGEATSTCITEGVADGWIRGGKDSLIGATVGVHLSWVVETGTSTVDLVGVILPSFVFSDGVEE